ncbi:LysM peptidoglycan-binding domain-containing protein [Vreelandella rituensis]|uniref:LysM peptidoglycan-binding domain-containing protein n=1 Tax=Vreelandella rituensis TaxID=2282306 RepID=UPI001F2AA38E|nr:LysM peptidoglycan-binding domain-containing protein [Halomonas rituensis]
MSVSSSNNLAGNNISGNWVVVRRGDTLGKLASRANVPLERLQRFNPGVDSHRLTVGQRLLMPTQQERAPSGGPYRYQVRPGDTYSAIARHFATTPARIQQANSGISPTQLRIGQVISVPLRGTSTITASSGSRTTPSQRNTTSPTPAASINMDLPASARQWAWPLNDYRIVRRFGPDSRGTLQPMLLATEAGAKALAVAPGEVRFASTMRQLGQVVIVHHDNNLQSVYALCDKLLVKESTTVSRGDPLCEVGQSVTSQRYDLLFDLRQAGKPIDPRQVLK